MRLAIGTVQFGLNYGINNQKGIVAEKELNSILNDARKNKINLLDTAQAYGNSESRLGSVDSSEFKFISKLKPGILVSEVYDSVQISCQNLNVTNLEGVLFHDFKDYNQNPKLIDELIRLKRDSVIKKIGFSLYHPIELDALFSQNIDFDILQIPFSIYDQRFKKYFKEIKKRNIEIHVRSVFLQGLVFMNPDKLSKHFDKYKHQFLSFQNNCLQLKQSIASVCLNYVYGHNEIDRVIIGVCSSKELMDNIIQIKSNSINFSKLKFDNFKIIDESIILPFNWK
jgi:aryl-alcohol dehydrogenase-like predicted oxidoreductase